MTSKNKYDLYGVMENPTETKPKTPAVYGDGHKIDSETYGKDYLECIVKEWKDRGIIR